MAHIYHLEVYKAIYLADANLFNWNISFADIPKKKLHLMLSLYIHTLWDLVLFMRIETIVGLKAGRCQTNYTTWATCILKLHITME